MLRSWLPQRVLKALVGWAQGAERDSRPNSEFLFLLTFAQCHPKAEALSMNGQWCRLAYLGIRVYLGFDASVVDSLTTEIYLQVL